MGFPVGVTTTAARWLFKNLPSRPNNTITRYFVGLGSPIKTTKERGAILALSPISTAKNDAMRESRAKVAFNRKFMLGGERTFTSSSSTKDIEPLEPVLNGEEERQNLQKISKLTLNKHEAILKSQITTGDASSCWKEAADSYQKSAEYWKKTSRAYKHSLNLLVEGYSSAAKQSELTADQSREAAEMHEEAVGDDARWREGNRWREAGKATQLSIDYRIKGMEPSITC